MTTAKDAATDPVEAPLDEAELEQARADREGLAWWAE